MPRYSIHFGNGASVVTEALTMDAVLKEKINHLVKAKDRLNEPVIVRERGNFCVGCGKAVKKDTQVLVPHEGSKMSMTFCMSCASRVYKEFYGEAHLA